MHPFCDRIQLMLSWTQTKSATKRGFKQQHYITVRQERQPNPMLLLLAVPLPPPSLQAFGPLIEERTIDTRYGPVGPLASRGRPERPPVWIQPYYGLPSRTDPRATLQAAQALDLNQIVAWDAAVALNPILAPGQPMLIADYIDFTRHQPQTFLEGEESVSPGQAPAVCPRLTEALSRLLPTASAGVYLGVDGPRRETAAEARMFRSWGADAIGQNLVPEIALARERGLCFAGLVTIDDVSAERLPQPAGEQDNSGLETVVQALSDLLQTGDAHIPCHCGRPPFALSPR